MPESITFPGGTVNYEFNSSLESQTLFDPTNSILITDSNIAAIYSDLLSGYRTIVVPAGESSKTWSSINHITQELIGLQSGKDQVLVGLGGGMITDLTGFAASIYMRGVPFGFVPTTLLGMVDASIGGKNGIDYGVYKNMLGTIRQPAFILFDPAFLDTLPENEWSNGFAEIIKYACIFDRQLFEELSEHNLSYYRENKEAIQSAIRRCVRLKNDTVLEDEQDRGIRRLLNFGHTAGHALEQQYGLAHGEAVAIGMVIACIVSESTVGLSPRIRAELTELLRLYGLPTSLDFDAGTVMDILCMDKKRTGDTIAYIVLKDVGAGAVMKLAPDQIRNALEIFLHDSHR